MIANVARRLGVFALSLLGASILIFLVCQALPGDPARILLGDGRPPRRSPPRPTNWGRTGPCSSATSTG